MVVQSEDINIIITRFIGDTNYVNLYLQPETNHTPSCYTVLPHSQSSDNNSETIFPHIMVCTHSNTTVGTNLG